MTYINKNNEVEMRKYIGLAGLIIKYEIISPPYNARKLAAGDTEEENNIDNAVVIKK